MITILDVNKKYSVDNYPYGFKQTTATFGVEFKAKKGFRSFFQTINPVNHKLNKEKNGTYSDFMCVTCNSENGHYEWHHESVNGLKAIVKTLAFISTNFDALQLTREMHQWIASKAIASIIIGNALYVDELLTFLHTSQPSMPGNIKSKMIAAGLVARNFSSAALPSYATSIWYPSFSRYIRSSSTMFFSSSTNSSVVMVFPCADSTEIIGRTHRNVKGFSARVVKLL